MIKYIKRKSDNKFLQSLENDLWVDNTKDAYEMTYRECEETKTTLLNTYTSEEITEVALEMDRRLNGTWIETDEDSELQARFKKLRDVVPQHRFHKNTRIGADFLRRYQHLL